MRLHSPRAQLSYGATGRHSSTASGEEGRSKSPGHCRVLYIVFIVFCASCGGCSSSSPVVFVLVNMRPAGFASSRGYKPRDGPSVGRRSTCSTVGLSWRLEICLGLHAFGWWVPPPITLAREDFTHAEATTFTIVRLHLYCGLVDISPCSWVC